MENKPGSVQGDDHPITIEQNPNRILVVVAGEIIADTQHALTLYEANYPPIQYIPRKDVNMALLKKNTNKTYCPYKGECAYFDIPLGGKKTVNAVWCYENPYPAVEKIKDHIAFYSDRVDSIRETQYA